MNQSLLWKIPLLVFGIYAAGYMKEFSETTNSENLAKTMLLGGSILFILILTITVGERVSYWIILTGLLLNVVVM